MFEKDLIFKIKKKIRLSLLLVPICFFTAYYGVTAQDNESLKLDILSKAKIEAARKEVDLTIQSVDISKFPIIKVLIEAYNKLGEPLDSLSPENIFIYESGERKQILEVQKIPVAEKIAVDFIFAIDKTGSMQQYIDAVRNNIVSFAQKLVKRGINYRLGLILFSDEVEKVYQPTTDVYEFLNWISVVKAFGGGDEKENSLEALNATTKMNFRHEASKVVILITDAPFHQVGETGEGLTKQSQKSIVEQMQKTQTRVFTIAPEKLKQYEEISKRTRGNFFDLDYPFSTVLDNFSNQLTCLYNVTYQSAKSNIPDSIEIGFYDVKQRKLIKKTIPIIELGRKLILEHLLFGVASYELPEDIAELNILADFMQSRPEMKILIEGHTDYLGEIETNQILSERRAEEVKKYLIKRGISTDRIQSVGFGELKPIASNASAFGRQLNRRTEIVILSK
jgi:outer membrane protein OmpA-like peptidoglycan-associated protein